jgi:membrane protein YqaA with SNARE-associated domain
MRGITHWILATFASPAGVFALAALDATLFFSLPFGIDAVVIILAARGHPYTWMVPVLAAAGSAFGAAITFWMGMKIGEAGLDRHVPRRQLQRIRSRLRRSGAVGFAILTLIPPPFPFTLFVLAAGALEVRAATFFVVLIGTRMLRFGFEAWLALLYGRPILAWIESDLFQGMVGGVTVLAIVLSALSIARVVTASRPARRAST